MTRERVLIAGAGPVGLVSAACLAAAGIPVVVFEAEADLPTDLRASTFHPPTLDLLDRFPGVTDRLLEQGLIARQWQYRDRRAGPVVTWDMGLLAGDTAHPYRLQAEQWKLTRILRERLRDAPEVEFRFGHRVTSVFQDGNSVDLAVVSPDGPETVRGRFVIGADGANSAVRQVLDVAYDGLTFPELFLTYSTPFEFADHFPGLTYVNYIADPEEWFVLLRVVGNWRVLIPAEPEGDREHMLTDEYVQQSLNGIVARDEPYEIFHRTLYNVHQRVASRYRVGRVLLAGDAAHINNPLGGMGMNGGIQDAFNLADKLVAVWRGEAEADLLDRYERQRRKIALDFVQESTTANRAALRESDPAVRAKRYDELRAVADDPERARAFLLRSSMITAQRDAESIQ